MPDTLEQAPAISPLAGHRAPRDIARIRALLAHVDAIRLDHFRGFAAAWHVPAGASTAQAGEWVPGPGSEFFNAARSNLGVLPFVAEDLGHITPDVSTLRDEFEVPGTRVLQFAFDGHSDNIHLPDNYGTSKVVAYTGTHDNATTGGWFEALPDGEQRNGLKCLGRATSEDPRCGARVDPHGLVVAGRPRDRASAGSVEFGQRGTDERTGWSGRKLAVARDFSHAVRRRLSMAKEFDADFKQIGPGSGAGRGGGIMSPTQSTCAGKSRGPYESNAITL